VAPEDVLLVVIILALTVYALFAGADFGAGIWEVNTAWQATPEERKLLFSAIGPVWEANHVWLIFVLVAMFGAFPSAFAAVCQALWLPLILALVGIVFRGIGYAFRVYSRDRRQQLAWELLFATGSAAAPFFLGASIGALASGQLKLESGSEFDGSYLSNWLSPMSLFTGFFVVVMCAYLAAVYLAREAHVNGLSQLALVWRQRALGTGIWTGVLAVAGVAYLASGASGLWAGFQARSWPLVALSVLGGFLSLASLVAARYHLAVISAAVAVTTVIWGWAVAQYPYLVPPSITVESAKAPDNILWLLIGTTAVGSLLLLPALGYLLYLFKSRRSAQLQADKQSS